MRNFYNSFVYNTLGALTDGFRNALIFSQMRADFRTKRASWLKKCGKFGKNLEKLEEIRGN